LSGTGLCDELITRPQESYRLWCFVVCDLETPKNEEAMAHWGLLRQKKKNVTRVSLYASQDNVRHKQVTDLNILNLGAR